MPDLTVADTYHHQQYQCLSMLSKSPAGHHRAYACDICHGLLLLTEAPFMMPNRVDPFSVADLWLGDVSFTSNLFCVFKQSICWHAT